MSDFEASVIIATFNRGESLARMLNELAAQSVERQRFEVVVVDDGSKDPAAPFAKPFEDRVNVRVIRQANGGVAAARQRGAREARGRILCFLDDDMVLHPEYLAAHLAVHGDRADRVVMGRLRADANIAEMPLFERFFAHMLERFADEWTSGKTKLRGDWLYTGNVSMPKELFLQVGGFDADFLRIEDAELGVRLEKAGAEFLCTNEGYSIHASDHASLDKWLARSVMDGVYWTKVARKHPDVPHANPWKHLTGVNPLSRPVLALTVLAPGLAAPLAKTGVKAAEALDKIGLKRIAVAGTTLVYGIQYFRGVREETGSLGDVLREYRAFRKGLKKIDGGEGRATLLEAIRADHAALVASQSKYGGGSHGASSERKLFADAVNNIGFQIMVAYRVMRALHLGGNSLGAKFVSRLVRHLYGSDIHWEATLEPGVVLVHGFGLALSPKAYVSTGCILFQHVTLGLGLGPAAANGAKESGAPFLEKNVHVGANATLFGPIRVGEGSKIMANVTLATSVAPRSIVQSPEPTVTARKSD